jgi:hypothetical protein
MVEMVWNRERYGSRPGESEVDNGKKKKYRSRGNKKMLAKEEIKSKRGAEKEKKSKEKRKKKRKKKERKKKKKKKGKKEEEEKDRKRDEQCINNQTANQNSMCPLPVVGSGRWNAMRFFAVSNGLVTSEYKSPDVIAAQNTLLVGWTTP